MRAAIPLVLGFLLDLMFGDPSWLPHPVVAMGRGIHWLENQLRPRFPKTQRGEFLAGLVVACLLPLASFGVGWGILWAAGQIHWLLALGVESFLCFQILATKSLKGASAKIETALDQGDLVGARVALSQIVGRDTQNLDQAAVIRGAVETVAENTSDGVLAPLLFMALGGAPLGLFYKAVNTMDSMIGYKNKQYRFFGTAAAKLDDLCNWIPARVTALLMILSSGLLGYDFAGAWRVLWRDRKNHLSPNAPYPEAACAGALGIQLGGGSNYHGKFVVKPTIGDPLHTVEPGDIHRTNRLLVTTAGLGLLLSIALRWLLLSNGQ